MQYYKYIFHFVKRPLKSIKLFIKQKAGWLGVPRIILFRGYGNESEFYIKGRVVEDAGLAAPERNQPVWKNILSTLKRFSSDEMPGIEVKAQWKNNTKKEKTDEFGYFTFRFDTGLMKEEMLKTRWIEIDVEMLDKVVENQPEIQSTGEVILIPGRKKRILISDIDDTVLVSYSTQVLKKLRLMLFKNAYTRLPMPGVENFYQMLEKGKEGNENFSFFFVSSSEWNLYDLLEDFFSIRGLPKGPFILRKMEHSIYKFWKSGSGSHQQKYQQIKQLLRFYKSQKFILFGDSGQRDPVIYRNLALEYPDRIEAIYIRKIKTKRSGQYDSISDELEKYGVLYEEISNMEMALQHARNNGFIK